MNNDEKDNAFGIINQANSVQNPKDAEKVAQDFAAIFDRQKKQKDNLLGKFVKGKYVLDDEAILYALKALPKKFESKDEQTVYLSAKLEEFVLNFKIVFDITPSFCKAELYFFEIEHALEEDVKHTTLLDSVLEVYSPKFKDEVYLLWKVYIEENPYEKDDYLLNLLRDQKEDFLNHLELVEILSQLFLMRMLKALEGCGELGQQIKKEYNDIVEGLLQIEPGLAQDNFRLKFILDSLIEKHGALPTVVATTEGYSVLTGFVNPMKRVLNPPSIMQEAGNKPIEKAKEEKKKTVAKPKKGKVKSKGSKAKPANAFDMAGALAGKKKKDDKKEEPKKLFVGPSKEKKDSEPTKEPAPEKTSPQPQKQEQVLDQLLNNISFLQSKQKNQKSDGSQLFMNQTKGSKLFADKERDL